MRGRKGGTAAAIAVCGWVAVATAAAQPRARASSSVEGVGTTDASPSGERASRLGAPRSATLALERPFGIHVEKRNGDGARTFTVGGAGWQRNASALHQPRAAFDYFPVASLSVGVAAGLYAASSDDHGVGVLLAPRFGYAGQLSRSLAVWTRAGVTWFSEDENGGGARLWQLAGSAETLLLFLPNGNWAALIGPTADVAFAGALVGETVEARTRDHAFGVTTGLLAHF
jgi:hypothetical protein